ncbi:hypothetical protein DL770_001080 [Monosporascus sp. CRB-9-2]|nr:hypothetical protein DL770_001080 [Monosporascus sp. CRB-9-2]
MNPEAQWELFAANPDTNVQRNTVIALMSDAVNEFTSMPVSKKFQCVLRMREWLPAEPPIIHLPRGRNSLSDTERQDYILDLTISNLESKVAIPIPQSKARKLAQPRWEEARANELKTTRWLYCMYTIMRLHAESLESGLQLRPKMLPNGDVCWPDLSSYTSGATVNIESHPTEPAPAPPARATPLGAPTQPLSTHPADSEYVDEEPVAHAYVGLLTGQTIRVDRRVLRALTGSLYTNGMDPMLEVKVVGKLVMAMTLMDTPANLAQPGIYPMIAVSPQATISHKQNQYSLFSPAHQDILFEALKLRCHTEERLVARQYLTSSELTLLRDDVYVPQGVNLTDIISTHPLSRGLRIGGPKRRVYVPKGVDLTDIISTHQLSRGRCIGGPKRRVVVLDCEMVGVPFWEGDNRCEVSELGQLCAVDALTGEVLIDMLVQPAQKVSRWRTRYSGLTPAAMRSARSEGRLLYGWEGARSKLLKYVGPDTILIGQDLQSDLFMLRLAHDRVVDTAIQTAEAVFGMENRFERVWKLKDLAKTLLGMNIQVGKNGHDCVEDTLATREVALWCLRFPRELEAWAQDMRELLERQRVERERKMEEEKKKKRKEEEEKKAAEDAAQENQHNLLDFGPPLILPRDSLAVVGQAKANLDMVSPILPGVSSPVLESRHLSDDY